MADNTDNIARARAYLQDIEAGKTGEELAIHFDADVVQEEFPNALSPQYVKRNLKAILEGAERGKQVLSGQRYEVQTAIASGEQVALEVSWTGTLAVPVVNLAAGDEMKANFAVFLEFRDGKIIRQRNYDCFEPFTS